MVSHDVGAHVAKVLARSDPALHQAAVVALRRIATSYPTGVTSVK